MISKKLSLLALPLVAAVSLQAQNPFNDPFFSDPFGDDIFKEMMQMQRQMDEMFKRMEQRMNQRSVRLVHPSMGMYKLSAQSDFVDKGDHYEMVTNIPESKENHIDIRTQNGMITISAKIVHEEEQKTNGMVSTSRSIQSFQQSTSLPADADENGIKSKFVKGRLVIEIPKKQGEKVVPAKPAAAPSVTITTPKTAAKPAASKTETVKIPSLDKVEKKKEAVLPKIDEKLKSKQPTSETAVEKKEETNASPEAHPAMH
jgi:HSP20 family molecular chaperone IbpA